MNNHPHPGRPRGGEEKQKTTIRISKRMRAAISALVAFDGCRSYSDALEYAVVKVARNTVKERGIEDQFPELSNL